MKIAKWTWLLLALSLFSACDSNYLKKIFIGKDLNANIDSTIVKPDTLKTIVPPLPGKEIAKNIDKAKGILKEGNFDSLYADQGGPACQEFIVSDGEDTIRSSCGSSSGSCPLKGKKQKTIPKLKFQSKQPKIFVENKNKVILGIASKSKPDSNIELAWISKD